MGIQNRWWAFSDTLINTERDSPGVYELGDGNGFVVYVGSSIEVRRRLLEHFNQNGTCIKRRASVYRVEYTTATECRRRERELYDEHVARYGAAPACNEVRP